MKKYEKPVVIIAEELCEGIYMESGDPVSQNYILKKTYAGNEWDMNEQYELEFIDYDGNGPYTATAILSVTGSGVTAVSINTGNGTAKLDGDKITVMLNGWSQKIQLAIRCSSHSFSIS